MNKKVLIGMSGGVDSSVAAYLLKEQGYDVTGVTMRLCEKCMDRSALTSAIESESGSDFDSENVRHARSVAEKLDIDFITLDCQDEFIKKVVDPFIETYEKGMTPNPCIECNRCIKFDLLKTETDETYVDSSGNCDPDKFNLENTYPENYSIEKAGSERYSSEKAGLNNCDSDRNPLLATGHYAAVEYKDGRWKLKKSDNMQKDQSYFLYTLSQDILSRVIFPLGNMTKEEVRQIAADNDLITARKKESQDICFIPDGDYSSFIQNYSGEVYPPGDFVDIEGNILGKHRGIIHYTIGQRKGLGLALKKPMYVYKLDTEKNNVVLAENETLFSDILTAGDFNWVSMADPLTVDTDNCDFEKRDFINKEPNQSDSANKDSDDPYTGKADNCKSFRALGRIRYRHKEAACTVTPKSDGTVIVVFDEPQRAITAGQSLVLYDIETDTYVLGGGIIR